MLDDLIKDLDRLKNPVKSKLLQRFFKTGKGQYGEGDIFLGVMVPQQREVAKKYKDLGLDKVQTLLDSKIHEYRLVALLILMTKYKRVDEKKKKQIVDFYLKNTKNINNWDLVDLSCRYILGAYFFDKDRKIFYKLARSKKLWERRIAIISTAWFIGKSRFGDTIKISEILLRDKHDLIHKAVGWMLREVGKRDRKVLENFLDKYSKIMPRTCLRYAIEKLDEKKRKHYLS